MVFENIKYYEVVFNISNNRQENELEFYVNQVFRARCFHDEHEVRVFLCVAQRDCTRISRCLLPCGQLEDQYFVARELLSRCAHYSEKY